MHLVTGTTSGLGKFLLEELNAVSFCRQSQSPRHNEPFEAIIHCAFNINRNITATNFHKYINDNFILAQRLLAIPHNKFIFVSSSDVYPRDAQTWKEDDDYPIEKVEGLYGLSKLMIEEMIKAQSNNCLILRPTALLGKYSRANSLMKILYGDDITLSLDPASRFNYILHEDVLGLIRVAMTQDMRGVFNLAASDTISLGDVAEKFKRHVKFGSYTYNGANICNKKAIQSCDIFSRSSLENIERFNLLMEDKLCSKI